MRGDMEMDSNESASIIHEDFPDGSTHIHESKGMNAKFILWIHMNDVSYDHDMNTLLINVRCRL